MNVQYKGIGPWDGLWYLYTVKWQCGLCLSPNVEKTERTTGIVVCDADSSTHDQYYYVWLCRNCNKEIFGNSLLKKTLPLSADEKRESRELNAHRFRPIPRRRFHLGQFFILLAFTIIALLVWVTIS
jgi:hypothetical protein